MRKSGDRRLECFTLSTEAKQLVLFEKYRLLHFFEVIFFRSFIDFNHNFKQKLIKRGCVEKYQNNVLNIKKNLKNYNENHKIRDSYNALLNYRTDQEKN